MPQTKYQLIAQITYLRTQVEVAEENCGLGAGDDQDDEHEEEEAVHVVDLAAPDAVQHKEELDEKLASRVQVSQRAVAKIIQVKNSLGHIYYCN